MASRSDAAVAHVITVIGIEYCYGDNEGFRQVKANFKGARELLPAKGNCSKLKSD